MKGHVHKRGKTWSYVVDVGYHPDGRRRQTTKGGFRTRRDAESVLRKVLEKVERGSYREASRQTLRDYLVQEWLPSLSSTTLSPTTKVSYEGHVRHHIASSDLGSVRVSQLTPGRIESFLEELRKKRTSFGKTLSPGTVQRIRATLSTALSDAVPDLIERSPMPPRRRGRARTQPAARPKPWTAAEAVAFFEFVKDDRLLALWWLSATAGGRRGDSLGLTWSDLDMRTGVLTFRSSLVPAKRELHVREGGKSGRVRAVELDDVTIEVLRSHKARQAREKLVAGEAYQDSGYIFCNETGRPLNPDSVSKRFALLVKKSRLRRVRFHDLRHLHATLGLDAGVDIKVMSDRLGHSSTAITQDLYTHVQPGMQKAAAQKIVDRLRPR